MILRTLCVTRESVAAAALAACLVQDIAHAQAKPASFGDLESVLKPGQKVVVTNETGRRTKGAVLSISTSELVLVLGPLNERRTFAGSVVKEVGDADSLLNGAGIGATVGAALGLAFVPAYYDCLRCGGDTTPAQLYSVFGILGAVGGALAGAGIDSSMNKSLFVSSSPQRGITLSPLLGHERRGVVASLRF